MRIARAGDKSASTTVTAQRTQARSGSPDARLRSSRTPSGIDAKITPILPSAMKLREELETVVGEATLVLRLLEELGFRVWFRYEKYREEFALDDVIIAVDETPVGTYVEIEGGERGIAAAAEALGRKPADYVLDSYRGLFLRHCQGQGAAVTDMLFDSGGS